MRPRERERAWFCVQTEPVEAWSKDACTVPWYSSSTRKWANGPRKWCTRVPLSTCTLVTRPLSLQKQNSSLSPPPPPLRTRIPLAFPPRSRPTLFAPLCCYTRACQPTCPTLENDPTLSLASLWKSCVPTYVRPTPHRSSVHVREARICTRMLEVNVTQRFLRLDRAYGRSVWFWGPAEMSAPSDLVSCLGSVNLY